MLENRKTKKKKLPSPFTPSRLLLSYSNLQDTSPLQPPSTLPPLGRYCDPFLTKEAFFEDEKLKIKDEKLKIRDEKASVGSPCPVVSDLSTAIPFTSLHPPSL